MSDVLGNSLKLMVFGESHGPLVGATISGLPSGIKIDENFITSQLNKRKANDELSTQRQEDDSFHIVSGVFNGYTTGTALTILIENNKQHSSDYKEKSFRPGHADYTGEVKYNGYQDYRGGGHFSGRITAGLVAAGAIVMSALEKNGIYIGTHIKRCAKIDDVDFTQNLEDEIKLLSKKPFATLSDSIGEEMQKAIIEARDSLDSVGGILETAVIGMPAGVGEPWFDSVESTLSHALFSIPAVKGVEFGLGFEIADKKGSQANDPFRVENGKIVSTTNNSGGINGGITNGMPIIFRTAVRPTPTIGKEQETVDMSKRENAILSAKGRHDPCIVHRARIVQDCVSALVIYDMMATRFGTDWAVKK